jgi:hypothetical protein
MILLGFGVVYATYGNLNGMPQERDKIRENLPIRL